MGSQKVLKKKRINLRVSEKHINLLRYIAKERGLTMTELIEEWIVKKLTRDLAEGVIEKISKSDTR